MRLKGNIFAAAILAVAGQACAQAEGRVYTGDEGNALLCAHVFSLSAVLLEREHMIGTREKDMMIAYSVHILETYVSGTWDQKMAAQEILADRTGILGTLQDFQRYSDYCFQRFPFGF